MRVVHLVFYIFMLEPAIPNTFMQCSNSPLALVIIDREPKYKIFKIVNSKIDCWRVYKLLYKVIWLGYKNTKNNSRWLPATELTHAQELISDFYSRYPSKPRLLKLD